MPNIALFQAGVPEHAHPASFPPVNVPSFLPVCGTMPLMVPPPPLCHFPSVFYPIALLLQAHTLASTAARLSQHCRSFPPPDSCTTIFFPVPIVLLLVVVNVFNPMRLQITSPTLPWVVEAGQLLRSTILHGADSARATPPETSRFRISCIHTNMKIPAIFYCDRIQTNKTVKNIGLETAKRATVLSGGSSSPCY